MRKIKNKSGMTLAEILIVVAIIAVLGGLAFIAVYNHQRSLGQLERDGIAKEIFVAAQNHLTIAYGQGYLGLTKESGAFGAEDDSATAEEDDTVTGDEEGGAAASTGEDGESGNTEDKDIFYLVVDGSTPQNSVIEQVLPFGSIDETVRAGGGYIIRYQRKTGLVIDVFYWTRHGSPEQFNYQGENENDYKEILTLAGDEANKKAERRDYDGSIIGWYGGAEAATLPTIELEAPTITVHNEEKLYVEVSNPNKDISDASLKLIITGVDSKAQKAYELKFPVSTTERRVKTRDDGENFTVFLDDVASSGLHFGDIVADTASTTGEKFIPGEDITIQAVAYSKTALSNIAYSTKYTTNSIFSSINSAKDTAYIGNIRHLENLDKSISNLDANDDSGVNDHIKIAHAEQTDSFSWTGFQKEVKKIETKSSSTTGEESEDGYEAVGVFDFSGTSTVIDDKGYFKPIEPDYTLTYNGQSHSISDVAVNIVGDAGLFGDTSSVTAIKDLELIDFSIIGKSSASVTSSVGALAGTLKNCTVTNVLARNKDISTDSLAKKITAPTNAGGLIGNLIGGTVQYSAATVFVDAGTAGTAGGLIGTASGTIKGCYSGGHTAGGSYDVWIHDHGYDVTGLISGGLIGDAGNSSISYSYSTCSVTGYNNAGGFVGTANGVITNCYCTGRVRPDYQSSPSGSPDKSKIYENAFLIKDDTGLGSGSSGNYYYYIINEVLDDKDTIKYKMPGNEVVTALDTNAKSYNDFVGAWDSWNPARAYDSSLVKYYGGKYTLRTVDELNPELPDIDIDNDGTADYDDWNKLFVMTHYGDWPAPEIFIING